MIHSTALISQDAELGTGVEIGPFAVVEAGAVLGDGVRIGSHAVVRRGVTLGARVRIDSSAVIGGDPQDFKFDPQTPSGVVIGGDCWIREHVTVHRSTREGGLTRLGDRVFLMATAHVAHDCVLEDDVIMANAVLLGGHVTIGTKAFIGGAAAIHQFVRIGEGAMVGGHGRIAHDVPPWVMAAERDEAHGINVVGLRRRGHDAAALRDLKACYKAVMLRTGAKRPLAEAARAAGLGSEAPGRAFLDFIIEGGRRPGFVRSTREGLTDRPEADGKESAS